MVEKVVNMTTENYQPRVDLAEGPDDHQEAHKYRTRRRKEPPRRRRREEGWYVQYFDDQPKPKGTARFPEPAQAS